MKWFKMWTEARNDAKLNSLSDTEFRIWYKLLCYAAEQDEAGTIKGYDFDLLVIEVTKCNSDVTECNSELQNTLEKLKKLQIITLENDIIIFKNFKKRNEKPKYESKEEVKKRVAKHRESKSLKNVTGCNRNVTEMKQGVTACNRPEEEEDIEEDIKSTPPTPSFTKPTIPYTEFAAQWNLICSGNFSLVNDLSDKRKKHISARWSEHPDIEFWKVVFNKLSASSFCTGNNDRGWKPDFNWIIKNNDNYTKVLEGKYDNRGTNVIAFTKPVENPQKPDRELTDEEKYDHLPECHRPAWYNQKKSIEWEEQWQREHQAAKI